MDPFTGIATSGFFSRSRDEWVLELWFNYELLNGEDPLMG